MNRIKCHVKKGDQVEVIAGNFRREFPRLFREDPGGVSGKTSRFS